jgi:hypothetical protein
MIFPKDPRVTAITGGLNNGRIIGLLNISPLRPDKIETSC